jgi:hypothetical protein
MTEPKGRKPEDTAAGCLQRASKHRAEAAGEVNAQMRVRLESSAEVWTKRANLLTRLESQRELGEEPEA